MQNKLAWKTGNAAVNCIRIAKWKLPDIDLKLLFRMHRAVVESKMLYGVEIWGDNQTWKYVDSMRARFCKLFLNITYQELHLMTL